MIRSATRSHSIAPEWLLWGFLILITAAELITSLVQPQAGLMLHAILLVGLLVYGASGEITGVRRLALALTLAPLIRVLSLSLPLIRFPQAAWYPIVAIPLLLSTWVIIRLLGVSRSDLGLQLGALPLQLMLMVGGFGLGAAEYYILRPAPLLTTYSWEGVILPALSLIIFTGFTEEIIFRGLLQSVARLALGRWALFYVALLFAVLHIGYLSLLDVLFVFAVGMLFGEIVRRGGSIVGVTLAHGITNVTLFLVMPYITQHPTSDLAVSAPWAIWGCTGIALIGMNFMISQSIIKRIANPMQPSNQLLITRRSQGLTYTDLAARTGLPARLLAEIEHGLRMPHTDQLVAIHQALGLTMTPA